MESDINIMLFSCLIISCFFINVNISKSIGVDALRIYKKSRTEDGIFFV